MLSIKFNVDQPDEDQIEISQEKSLEEEEENKQYEEDEEQAVIEPATNDD